MSADWLEIGRIFGSIVTVWFALVGWKLIPLVWGPAAPTKSLTESP